MTQRILMEGYYGRGNFGDDVLMHVTYGLLRQALPQAEIAVVIGEQQENYIDHLVDGIVVRRPERHAHFDLIVHGGGGVFFDFAHYGLGRRLVEAMVRLIGFQGFLTAKRAIRQWLGKPLPTTNHRIGLGIGVGTFSPGSPRMLRSLPILAEMDALWVRDAQSREHLKRFSPVLHAQIVEGSDLAFLTQYWLPPHTHPAPGARPRLGIALRDWPGTDIHALRNRLTKLVKEYDITGFIFDEKSDPLLREILSPFPTHIWQPHIMRLEEFATTLAAQDVLLTSRAHGAICGAALGVPSVIVNIEPKMQQVHAMLPNATMLTSAHDWQDVLRHALAITPEIIAADVAQNRDASQRALDALKRWLT